MHSLWSWWGIERVAYVGCRPSPYVKCGPNIPTWIYVVGIVAFLLASVFLYWLGGKTFMRKKKFDAKLDHNSKAVESAPNYDPFEGDTT